MPQSSYSSLKEFQDGAKKFDKAPEPNAGIQYTKNGAERIEWWLCKDCDRQNSSGIGNEEGTWYWRIPDYKNMASKDVMLPPSGPQPIVIKFMDYHYPEKKKPHFALKDGLGWNYYDDTMSDDQWSKAKKNLDQIVKIYQENPDTFVLEITLGVSADADVKLDEKVPDDAPENMKGKTKQELVDARVEAIKRLYNQAGIPINKIIITPKIGSVEYNVNARHK